MKQILHKLVIFVAIVLMAFGSYLYYHSLHNPVMNILDAISERVIGIDLDAIIDKLEPPVPAKL